jgi:hypothetical protein
MKTLTKDKIRQLTPEQQEMLGSLEAHDVKKKQELLERARGHGGLPVVRFVILAVLFVLASGSILYFKLPSWTLLVVTGFWWLMVIQLEVAYTNRRISALLELLEAEKLTGDDDAA